MHKTTKILSFLLVAMCALCACSAHAETYYWIGDDSAEWANGSNWSLTEGGEAANAYPNAYGDAAQFPSGANLTLNSYVTVGKIFTDGTLTLSGNGSGGVRTASSNNSAPLIVGGEGLLRLAGININVPYATKAVNAETQISNAVEIVEGTTNTFTLCVGNDRYASLYFRGAMSGSGRLVVRSNTESGRYQAYFYGDASQFSGSIADHRDGDEHAARIQFMAPNAVSGLATYDLAATYNSGGQNYVLCGGGGSDVTYQMGAINGEVHFDGNNNTKSTQYYGYTLEIGGKNEDCSFGGTIARSGYASNTKKVGTADLTFTGSQIPNITIENGTYIIGSTTALPDTMIFAGGAFSVADGVTVDPPSKFSSDSTAPVVFDDRGLDNVWGGGLIDARVPYGFAKKGAGTLTLTTAPTHTTKTAVEDGILVVPQGTTIAELSCDGGKLTVPLAGTEDDTTVLNITVLAEGTDYDALTNAVAIPGATVAVESDGGSGYIVKATRTAQAFTWTGAADTAWENAANWTVGGVTAMTAPLAIDTAAFPAGLVDKTNVVLSARTTVAEVVADSDVAFSGAQICSPMYRGEGTIVLGDGAGFYVNATTVVSNDLEIAGDVTVTPSTTYIRTHFYGDISGSGKLTLEGERPTYELAGDNSGFDGVIVAPKDSNDRNNVFLSSETAASEAADWTVYSAGGGSDGFLHFDSKTVKFGSLSGNLYFNAMSYAKNVLEIGALNKDMSLGGSFCYSEGQDSKGNWRVRSSGNDIRKVGTGNLTLKANRVRNVFLANGVVTLAHGTNSVHQETRYTFEGGTMAITGKTTIYDTTDNGDGSITTNSVTTAFADASSLIVDSTAPICFSNATEEVHTWSTALADTNVGGLTKKGAGTLTLTAVPLYTGLTTVEEGTLVLPSDSDIVFNPFSAGTLSGVTPTRFAYPANTTLTGNETWKLFEGTLDITNVTTIDLSAATFMSGQPYVVASATAITGYNKAKLNAIELTLPDGVDASKWVLKVMTIGNARSLCVAPATTPFRVIFR